MTNWIQHNEDGDNQRARSGRLCGRARRDQAAGSGTKLKGAFTRYVKKIDSQGNVERNDFEELWRALRAAVCYELRRCALWSSSPSFLGIYGWRSWSEREGGSSAVDELLADCYTHVFLKRLQRLKAQLEVRDDIDGLVFLYIRNFIHDRRKALDPVGFRVFETLRMAIREAVARGEVFVVDGDPKIRNDTVLAFAGRDGRRPPAERRRLESMVERWNNELLPDMMTAVGTERQALVERLRGHLLGLEAWGIEVFRFEDLVMPLKFDVRARWAAFLENEGGETVRQEGDDGLSKVVRMIHPDEAAETRDSFTKLILRIAGRLKRLDVSRKTRGYLTSLWGFLETYAVDERLEDLPSNRKVATRLQIPRERLPGLYDTLREVIRDDRTTFSMPLPVARDMSPRTAGAFSTRRAP